MLSRGGKREYLCPHCGSLRIYKALVFGFQKSFVCRDCGQWGPWCRRIKKPSAEVLIERKRRHTEKRSRRLAHMARHRRRK